MKEYQAQINAKLAVLFSLSAMCTYGCGTGECFRPGVCRCPNGAYSPSCSGVQVEGKESVNFLPRVGAFASQKPWGQAVFSLFPSNQPLFEELENSGLEKNGISRVRDTESVANYCTTLITGNGFCSVEITKGSRYPAVLKTASP